LNQKKIRVALAGNPNAGKTTLFNALTGAHQKVGNYPGVTVEKREGNRIRGDREYHFIDLPGIYSLTAYSIDEVVTRDFLLDEKPDVIVDVMDSTNLERHLYLCLQFQELGIPVVGALNMSDEAEAKGIRLNDRVLESVLGVPMAKTVGPKGTGVDGVLDKIDTVLDGGGFDPNRYIQYGEEIESKLSILQNLIQQDFSFCQRFPSRWLAVKLLEKDANAYDRLRQHSNAGGIEGAAKEAVLWLEKHYGKDAEIVVSEQRYGYIHGAVKEVIQIVKKPDFSFTESIDRVIMHPFFALPIFVIVLWAIFQLTFVVGEYPMRWLELFFNFLSVQFSALLPAGIFRSLVVDGIIGGVGGVLSFVPLIVLLFFFLSLLEDVGYMSRAAFATDKFLHAFGLHGQSVFPMMLGFGCSVPAIMAARTLKSRRDRILTILIIPFMSCGAKLPIYVLLSSAFFPRHAALMVMLVYAVGVVAGLLSAVLLRNTILRGDPTPFVMELPPYRMPTLRGILWHVWEKSWSYVKKAGTVILAASLIVWFITQVPVYTPSARDVSTLTASFKTAHPNATEAELASYLDQSRAASAVEYSFAGRLGKAVEPAFKPLGVDWHFAVATIAGFAAKELVVSTLGILYRVGTGGGDKNESLRDALRSDPLFNPLVALVMMLFILAIPPCLATLSTIKAELGWRWMGFSFVFMLAFGWILAFLVHFFGTLGF
jgi:ferrous iron transport protein B